MIRSFAVRLNKLGHSSEIFQEHFHHFAKVRIELVQRDGGE